MKSTPGPWFVKKCDWCAEDFACAISSDSKGKYFDATILGSDNRDECTHIMTNADAHLIAAAPELLEACKLSLIYCRSAVPEEETNLQKLLKQAIAKAEEAK